jgi:hypothetical protein
MHAETLALLTKPLYFPNMKYLNSRPAKVAKSASKEVDGNFMLEAG